MPTDNDFDENYNTKLSPDEEKGFQKWKSRMMPRDSGEDYDQRGAYKSQASPAKDGHWPDTYKKPNHPTFSNQSRYAPYAPNKAGSWNKDTYVPNPHRDED